MIMQKKLEIVLQKGYMTLVVEKLHGIKYINQGHNGWTAGDIAKEIESLGLSKADVYSVFLGTNDWWFGRPVGTIDNYKNNAGNETFFGSYRIIINKLRSLSKNARIILVAPMQRSTLFLLMIKEQCLGLLQRQERTIA